MYGFLLKKTFFDMWDNLLIIFMMNIGFILIAAGGLFLPSLLMGLFGTSNIVFLIGLTFAVVAFNLYAGIISFYCRDISDYQSCEWGKFPEYFRETWKSSLVLSGITVIQVIILLIAIPFYFSLGGIAGLAAMAVIFWLSVIWWFSAQYYFPNRARLDSKIIKIIKKALIIFFDNTFFSIVIGISTVFVVVISGLTAFMLPGITTVLLLHQVGLKLRLLKYDYIEANPEADRKKIPWDAILIEEKERVGNRTFRGMIFPWKE